MSICRLGTTQAVPTHWSCSSTWRTWTSITSSGRSVLKELDDLIVRGGFPPAIVACPDGTYRGWNRFHAKDSLYVNGLGGRFEDHILQEVVPFLMANYSIRPERQAHALVGFSAGGYGAMGLAIEHRDVFGAVATLAAPLNMRYSNSDGVYFEEFQPDDVSLEDTLRSQGGHRSLLCRPLCECALEGSLSLFSARGMPWPPMIIRTNPADLIWSTNLQPGELAIYVSYPGRDNFNFDAQAESFQWVADQRGIEVTVVRDPGETHRLSYFRDNQRPALIWLGQHLLPPAPSIVSECRDAKDIIEFTCTLQRRAVSS